jgi:translation initiation factor IF-2
LAKGIKVSELAKELNVPSKDILAKLKEEGVGEGIRSHASSVSLGLAESVRDWFKHTGTAVETGAPVEVLTAPAPTKTKASRRKKRTTTDDAESKTLPDPPAGGAAEEGGEQEPKKPEKVEKQEKPAPETPATQPVAEAPAPATAEPATPEPAAETATPQTPAAQPVPQAPKVVAPAATQDGSRASVARPTVTLATKAAQQQAAQQAATPAAERKAVIPAPKLTTLEPAKISGPKIVRIEKADHVPAPRPRRVPGQGESEPPAFTQALPRGGRGVRVVEDDEDDVEKKKAAKGREKGSLSTRRRGNDGRRGQADEKLREFSEADLLERQARLADAGRYHSGIDHTMRKSADRGSHHVAKSVAERGQEVELEEPITIKSLSAAIGVKTNEILRKLIMRGQMGVNVNSALDADTATMLAMEWNIPVKLKARETAEEALMREFESRKPAPEALQPRPPVVTILGHVDHGKTSLLDKIRNANVAAGEAGGITQHTAAWMVEIGEGEKRKRVTFIDTPGHHAFTAMRARGANMTDVVVLVVGAVEGVMPQTIESINHARAADVPIVVALNKIDRPDANPDMVLGQLAQQDLNPVEWGGQTEVIRTSALTGQGIQDLIEVLDLQAEILELKADPTAPARGTVIESRVDAGLGPVATVLVQDGTLKVGDVILSGPGYGRIRSLYNDRGVTIQSAGPSTPVIVSGLTELPAAGDKFFVVSDMERARQIAEERAERARQEELAQKNRVSSDNLLASMAAQDVKTINLIIKADVQGSVETLVSSVTAQNTEEVKVKVIHSGVGSISESDVQLAIATKAKPTDNRVAIIGFHVVPEDAARELAEQHRIDIKSYRVIYEIFDDLKKSLSGMLEPEIREKLHGHADIRQVFKYSKVGNIAGCMVTDGHIQRGSMIRLIRDGRVVTEGLKIETLRRIKEDVKEVKSGFECGIKLAGYDDIKEGDRLEAYVTEKHERTL